MQVFHVPAVDELLSCKSLSIVGNCTLRKRDRSRKVVRYFDLSWRLSINPNVCPGVNLLSRKHSLSRPGSDIRRGSSTGEVLLSRCW